MSLVRLPFELPPFSRVTWASAALRSKWGERIARVRRALEGGARPSRWRGILSSRTVKVYPYQEADWAAEARALGLDVRRLEALPGDWAFDEELRSGKAVLLYIGPRETVERALDADGLGAPPCCALQAEKMKPLALRSKEMVLWVSSVPDSAPGCVVLPQTWETNLFWHGIGVSLLPHVPCSMACERSRTLARELVLRMETSHLEEEAAWLRELLSWSLSWSALHGIAELKTPVFKACISTDATAGRHELQLEGSRPEDAAAGVGFPYRPRRASGALSPTIPETALLRGRARRSSRG